MYDKLKTRNLKAFVSVMASGSEQSSKTPVLHRDDADEEDENVKQLRQCSLLYLALQVFNIIYIILFFRFRVLIIL